MNRDRVGRWLGALLLALAAGLALHRYSEIRGWVRVEADVVGVEARSQRSWLGMSGSRRPVLSYSDRAGEDHILIPALRLTGFDPARDSRIPVIYNPEEPGQARPARFLELWGVPLIVLGLGGLSLALAVRPRRR